MFASGDVVQIKTHRLGRAGSTIGLARPMPNHAAPPQLVESVPYHDLREMQGFARRWRDEHRGEWFTVPRLSGCFLLMKRLVYDKIGGLDERFGIGFFNDDDLATRARRAGFELAVAHDLFIHHFGSRTFGGNGIDAERLLDENARRFAAKWGLPKISGTRIALRRFTGRPPIMQEKAESRFEPQMNQMNTDQNATLSSKRATFQIGRTIYQMVWNRLFLRFPLCVQRRTEVFDWWLPRHPGSRRRQCR
jgi:hypothetical protein